MGGVDLTDIYMHWAFNTESSILMIQGEEE